MGNKYYDGTKLLSLKDKNGEPPEIYMCVGNRTAGKSYYFKRLLVRRFLAGKGEFIVLTRFNYELTNLVDSFFKDIIQIDYPSLEYSAKPYAKGMLQMIYINGELAGYAVCLSSADNIKKCSSLFVNVNNIMFDEFQSEVGKYVPDEVKKLLSIHTSVARGAGEQVRYVPLFMISNNVSSLNPYYSALGLTRMIKKDTKFIRGEGFVFEQTFNESASEAMKSSAFNRAFENATNYLEYASENISLNDDERFIGIPPSTWIYKVTIQYGNNFYNLIESPDLGLIGIKRVAENKSKYCLCFTTADHDINLIMIERNSIMISTWRKFFCQGLFRFSDYEAKQNFIDIIAIR